MAHVLVGYNRIPKTGWLINNIHLFLKVQEAGRLLADLVSGKGPIYGSEMAIFSLGVHILEGVRKLESLL